MGVYRDLYLQTDALLLTYVLEKNRDTCSKLTVVEIDLDYNQEMYAMIEAGLRGGVPQTTCKKVEANIRYMGDDFDSSKESRYINFYLDAG